MNGAPLSLAWVGASGACADMRLNGHAVVTGTPVRIVLEHTGPWAGLMPTRVALAYELETLLAKVFGRTRQHMDTLALEPCRGRPYVAQTAMFRVPAPTNSKGSVRLRCDLVGVDGASAWLTATSTSAVVELATRTPTGWQAEFGAKALEVEGNLKLTNQPGSEVRTSRLILTSEDPLLEVSVVSPRDPVALNRYLTALTSESAELFGQGDLAQSAAKTAFDERYRRYMTNQGAVSTNIRVEPARFNLGSGESALLQVTATAAERTALPTMFALQVHDLERGTRAFSDLTLIERVEPNATMTSRGSVETRADWTHALALEI